MLKLLLPICILILVSCADINSSSGGSKGGTRTSNAIYTLTWASPSSFEDNTSLVPVNDLSEYRVYYGDSSANVTQNVVTLISPDKTSFSTEDLDPVIVSSFLVVFVAMTSVTKDGVESVLSDIVQFNP